MKERLDVEVQGLDELDRALDGLEPKLARRILKKALAAGGGVLMSAIQARAPMADQLSRRQAEVYPPGSLIDDIQVQVTLSDSKHEAACKVGPGKNTAWYAKFVEFGHDIGKRSKSLKGRKGRGRVVKIGHVPAHPFMRPAFEEARADAANATIEEIKANIGELTK